eukprot:6068225-Pyramimonas_sp.AAC.1
MGHETPYWAGETHLNCVTGAFGGAPSGATKRCSGRGGASELRQCGLQWSSHMRPRNAVCPGWGVWAQG